MAVAVETQTMPEGALRAALARLWTDHVVWTRQYIVAAVEGSADAEAAAGRLLKNQEDIGNAIVPFYGEDAGAALTALLKDHIMIAVGIVSASIADDEDAAKSELKRWDDNAGEIASLLAGANPNWPEDAVGDLLAQHLNLTKHELLARLNDEWADDVAAFDDILTEILTVAGALADGLIAQFPDRFRSDGNATAGLDAAMRRLWTDHAVWTRQYIVSAVAGRGDAEAAAGRLLKNQEDIGNAIVPFYGQEAGEALTGLLKDHIMIAVDLVAAAKKGDSRAFRRHDRRWEANADEIASFLAGANPNWPEADVRDLLGQHLALTKGEAVARLEENWANDVAAWDDILTEILTMADALSAGLVAQFPEKFEASKASSNGTVRAAASEPVPATSNGHAASNGQGSASLGTAMRRLWTDHVIWTRQYIVSAVAGSPDADAAAGRLLKNQEDIGNAVVPFYGEEAGKALTGLLKEHIMIAVDLVAAAKKGDNRAFKRHDKRWDTNADQIASFLAGANPNWPEEAVRDLLGQHLSLTKGEAVARLQENWDDDVAAFDDILTEILTMADALSDGLVAQFPEKFNGHAPSHAASHSAAPAGAGASAGNTSNGGKRRFASSFGR